VVRPSRLPLRLPHDRPATTRDYAGTSASPSPRGGRVVNGCDGVPALTYDVTISSARRRPASEFGPNRANSPCSCTAKGQTLRLRVDAFTFAFDRVSHPSERGLQVTANEELRSTDAAVTRDWERRHAAKVVARLPAGTVLRVERIESVPSADTATIVPRAVLADGPALGGGPISLAGISTTVPGSGGGEYPYPAAPDPRFVEVISAK
jgi:hypothetical protein